MARSHYDERKGSSLLPPGMKIVISPNTPLSMQQPQQRDSDTGLAQARYRHTYVSSAQRSSLVHRPEQNACKTEITPTTSSGNPELRQASRHPDLKNN